MCTVDIVCWIIYNNLWDGKTFASKDHGIDKLCSFSHFLFPKLLCGGFSFGIRIVLTVILY